MTDLIFCTTEADTTVYGNYIPILKKRKEKESLY